MLAGIKEDSNMVKKIILFPGQGSLKKDIVREKYTDNKMLKRSFEEISEYSKCNLQSKLMNDEMDDIDTISYIIFATSISTYREFIEETDLQNAIFAGHSLGEITALTCANALDIRDAVRLIKKRIMLAKEVNDGGMYVISNMDRNSTISVCKNLRDEGNKVWVSCDNTERQVCIAGDYNSIDKAAEILEKLGARVHKMKSNLPYHCNLLLDKAVQLKNYIEMLDIRPLQHIVLSNVFALPYESEKSISMNLSLQFSSMVKWGSIVEYLALQNYDESYEMAYSNTLTRSSLNKFIPSNQ